MLDIKALPLDPGEVAMLLHACRTEVVPTAELTTWPGNPRTITQQVQQQLDASLETFELVEPLVCTADYQLVSGHQRLDVLLSNGVEDVEVVVLPADWPAAKIVALAIALNRGGRWDTAKLPAVLGEISADGVLSYAAGFTSFEAQQVLSAVPDPPALGSATGDVLGTGGQEQAKPESAPKSTQSTESEPKAAKFRMGNVTFRMDAPLTENLNDYAAARKLEGLTAGQVVTQIVEAFASAYVGWNSTSGA